jgi:hypothetical protein
VITDPPFDAGAIHDNTADASPAMADSEVAAPDVVAGVADALALATPANERLSAVTRNEYDVPLVSPDTDALSTGAPLSATTVVHVVASVDDSTR